MLRRHAAFLLFLPIALIAASCGGAAPAGGVTDTAAPPAAGTASPTRPASIDTPRPADTATVTPSPSPTATPSPTDTPLPTDTPAPTTVPWVEGVVISEVLLIYTGPAHVFDSIGALGKGVQVRIVGVEPEFFWGQVDLGFDQTGWVDLGGVDWEGALTSLPQPELPPTPTPTFTPISPPEITRLNRLGGRWYFGLKGLQPDETVTISVYDSAGTLVASLTAVADSRGFLDVNFRPLDDKHRISGTYNFYLYGTGGWTLSFTRTWT